ncbi:MAG: hypothetical protein BWY91_02414 [bacterium ADurb.BinA028]|nr:MAG: hypothetical protein BWY91_02414 [bacterium ADurb.BinA028]
MLARRRSDVDDPVGATDDVQIVLDDKERVARSLEAIERGQQSFGVGWVHPGRRLIQDIDDAEQVGADLGCQPQTLQLPGGEGGRAALKVEIAEPELQQGAQAGPQIAGDPADDQRLLGMLGRDFRQPRRGAVSVGLDGPGEFLQGEPRQVGQVQAGERHGQGFRTQPLAVAQRARVAEHEVQRPLLHLRALGVRERGEDVPAGAGEGPLVTRLLLVLARPSCLRRCQAGIHGHHGLLVREEDPLALSLRQVAPRSIHVDPHRDEDVAQVLAAPGGRPGGDGPLADGQAVIRDEGLLGDLIDAAQAVAGWAGPLRGVR